MEENFEGILELTGNFGKFQKKLLFLFLMPVVIHVAFTNNLVYFQFIIPDYWCYVPERSQSEFSREEWKALTIPKTQSGTYEKCLQYKVNQNCATNGTCVTKEVQECVHGWDHDESLFWETVATDKGWLCDKEMYSTHLLAINFAGNAIGTLILPAIADLIAGRKHIFFIALGIHLLFNSGIIFFSQFRFQAIFRFIAGLAFQTNYQIPTVVTLEFVAPEYRPLVSFLSFTAWTMGTCFASLVAYLLPHWLYLLIICCVMSASCLIMWRIFPKSPRWLLSKGNIDECTKVLVEVAEMNGRTNITTDLIKSKLEKLRKCEKTTGTNLKELFHYPTLIKNMSLVIILALFSFPTYGCIVLNMNILPNNHFLNFFFLSAIELPANVIGWSSVNYLGRRMAAVFIYGSAAIFSIVAILFLDDRVMLFCIVLIVKIFASQTLYFVLVIVGEILPSSIRTSGIGVVVFSGMIGMLFSPYIIKMGELFQYSFLVIAFTLCVSFAVMLPETIGLPLPQSCNDAEYLGNDRPFFKWIHHWNVKNWKKSDDIICTKLRKKNFDEFSKISNLN